MEQQTTDSEGETYPETAENGEDRASVYQKIAAALFSLAFSELEEKSYQHTDFDEEDFSYEKMNMTRLFLNAGRMDGIREADIIKAVASATSLTGRLMGTIEIHTNFSFVDVPESYAEEIISNMRNSQIRGRSVSFERASKKRRGGSSGRKKSGRRTEAADRERGRAGKHTRESRGYFMENTERDMGRRKGGEAGRRRKNAKSAGKGRRRK